MQSYDYARRRGVEDITWERFALQAASLAEGLAREGVEVVIGIARAGLFPATLIACMLRRNLYPAGITRRVNDEVIYGQPTWKVDVSPEVAGKVVAVVDEIADTGETLARVAARARELGAARVITAALVSHTWAEPKPNRVALVSDALVLFPWDKQVLIGGRWQPHPELVSALGLQNDTH